MPTPSTGPTGRQPTATSLHLPPPRITYLTSRAVDTGRPGAATHLPPGPAALGLTPGLVGSPATVRPGTPQSVELWLDRVCGRSPLSSVQGEDRGPGR